MPLPGLEKLEAELLAKLGDGAANPPAGEAGEGIPEGLFGFFNVALEAGRPILAVNDDSLETPQGIWSEILAPQTPAASRLVGAARSVGGLTVTRRNGHQKLAGSAWLVRQNVAVTNRHVAMRNFAERIDKGTAARLRRNLDETAYDVRLDLRADPSRPGGRRLRVTEILHLALAQSPDLALLRVEPMDGGPVPAPIELQLELAPAERSRIAVIGFPTGDSDDELDDILLADRPGTKRVSPGEVVRVHAAGFTHDASTTQSSSGSPVVDLATGSVVGVHHGGVWTHPETGRLAINLAVTAQAVGEVLQAEGL